MASSYSANGHGARPRLKIDQGLQGRRPPVSDAPWWGLFAAGGTMAALFYPAQMIVEGILGCLGFPTVGKNYKRMRNFASNPLIKLFLLANISLPMFQAVHRGRLVMYDLGVQEPKTPIAAAWYGAGILTTLAAIWAILRLPGPTRR